MSSLLLVGVLDAGSSRSWRRTRCNFNSVVHAQHCALALQRRRSLSLQAVAVPPSAVADAVPSAGLPSSRFDTIEHAIAAVGRGEFVVVLDDEDRENEGDLIIAADKVTPAKIAFMVEYTSGVICVGLPKQECERLELPLMVPTAENEESMYTAFTVTVDLRHGITTGISATDRSATIRALGDPSTTAEQLRKPGHIFPLIARDGGVLVRPGHTEAAVDLARLAGSHPAGVLCEVVDRSSGEMARTDSLLSLAKAHDMKCVTIEALVNYRLRHETLISIEGDGQCEDRGARLVRFQSAVDGGVCRGVAYVQGAVDTDRPTVSFEELDLPASTSWEDLERHLEQQHEGLASSNGASTSSIAIVTTGVPRSKVDGGGHIHNWTTMNTAMLHGVLQELPCSSDIDCSQDDAANVLSSLGYNLL